MLSIKLRYFPIFNEQRVIDTLNLLLFSRGTYKSIGSNNSVIFLFKIIVVNNIGIICSDGPVAQSYKRGPPFIAIMSSVSLALIFETLR
jgi:hypothetical protein